MNKEEYMIDRMYDAMYEKYNEEATVPLTDYQELEDKYSETKYILNDLLDFIKNNDFIGAYEYAKSEELI